MQVGTSIGAPSLGERFGTLAVAVGLTVDEFSSVSAVVTMVKRGRSKMTGGTRVSVTQRFENDFSFFRNE